MAWNDMTQKRFWSAEKDKISDFVNAGRLDSATRLGERQVAQPVDSRPNASGRFGRFLGRVSAERLFRPLYENFGTRRGFDHAILFSVQQDPPEVSRLTARFERPQLTVGPQERFHKGGGAGPAPRGKTPCPPDCPVR